MIDLAPAHKHCKQDGEADHLQLSHGTLHSGTLSA
jgi:hypothetical protein